jgi:hypothetical protein
VLSRLIGEGPIEVAKSGLLVFLAVLAATSMQQLASTRAGQTVGERDRALVAGLARDFGRELTTYDYAHADVQEHRLSPLASSRVVTRVMTSFPDLWQFRATSIGEAPDAWVESLDGRRAQVLVRTKSTVQSSNVAPGTRASGLLLCDLDRQPSGSWRVGDFQWLTPATQGVS